MLRGRMGNLLVKLLGDLDETPTVNLSKPLEISKLIAQLQQGPHKLLDFVVVQISSYDIRASAISVLQKLKAAMSLAEFLVVERVDIFEIAIQGKKELCWVELGDAGCIYETFKELAHLLDRHLRLSLLPRHRPL